MPVGDVSRHFAGYAICGEAGRVVCHATGVLQCRWPEMP
jgi:hypothetical protein